MPQSPSANKMPPRIAALIGSTASGKSALALALAQETGASILSCDSLLIYRNLNIGTAKPSEEERRRIQHHGIDLVDLDQNFTAGDYVRYALPIVEKYARERKPLLIVGGTGFYLKALLCGVWDAPPTQPKIREGLENEARAQPEDQRAEFLHRKLSQLDPVYAAKVEANDVYRVIRALEIIETTGQKLSEILAARKLQNPLPFEVPILGIRRAKIELERRILERTNGMFAHGLVNETKALLERYPDPPRAMHCVGYHEVLLHLEGKMSFAECREHILISTRQLAKKQMTFFKTFPKPIQWFTLPAEEQTVSEKLRAILIGSEDRNR